MNEVRFVETKAGLPTFRKSRRLIERIQASYRAAVTDSRANNTTGSSPWSILGWNERQSAIVQALESGDAKDVHRVLGSFFVTDAAYGFSLGRPELMAIRRSRVSVMRAEAKWASTLRHTALCIGATRARNPELRVHAPDLAIDERIRNVVARIQTATRTPFDFPKIMGVFGCRCTGVATPVPELALNHYLVATWVSWLVDTNPEKSVIELGPGYGGVAYYFCRRFANLKARYTGIDLPFACAVQAFFLGSALGETKIRLYGERETGAQVIQLVPSTTVLAGESVLEDASVLLAQDSLIEMSASDAIRILRTVVPCIKSWMLVIGPDKSGSSASWPGTHLDALKCHLRGFHQVERTPLTWRRGYMRNLFAKA